MSDIVFDDMIEDDPSDTPQTQKARGFHDLETAVAAEDMERIERALSREKAGADNFERLNRSHLDTIAEMHNQIHHLMNEIERTRFFLITPPTDGSNEREWIMRLYRESQKITGRDKLTPAVDADGWITWLGGPCPVSPNTVVEVKFRRISETSGQRITGRGVASYYSEEPDQWRNDNNTGDIVAYRIAKGEH